MMIKSPQKDKLTTNLEPLKVKNRDEHINIFDKEVLYEPGLHSWLGRFKILNLKMNWPLRQNDEYT